MGPGLLRCMWYSYFSGGRSQNPPGGGELEDVKVRIAA